MGVSPTIRAERAPNFSGLRYTHDAEVMPEDERHDQEQDAANDERQRALAAEP